MTLLETLLRILHISCLFNL